MIKKQIARFFWGFVEPINDNRWTNGKSFDDYYCACEQDYHQKLNEIYKKAFIMINGEKITLRNDKKVIFEPSESTLHKMLKILTLHHLLTYGNIHWEDIKIEEPIPNSQDIKPDIIINENEPYEIETFYGKGDPEDRIVELIQNYQNNSKLSKIRIIITNLDAILWYRDLIDIKKTKMKDNIDIEFLTLDLRNNKLIAIETLKSRFLKSIQYFSTKAIS